MNGEGNGEEKELKDSPIHEGPKNLYQKLCDIVLSIGYIQALGNHMNFKYAKAIDIRKAIREEFASRGVYPSMSATEATQLEHTVSVFGPDKKTRIEKKTFRTQVKLEITFTNADNPSETLVSSWYGWGDGPEAHASYGAYTGGQRHFYMAALMLLVDVMDPEAWDNKLQKELDQMRRLATKRALEQAPPGTTIVGTAPEELTDEQKRAYDDDGEPIPADGQVEDPFDIARNRSRAALEEEDSLFEDTWRKAGLKAHPDLEARYKGKHVEDISLRDLVNLHKGFVARVDGREDGYRTPAQVHLSNALQARMEWEVANKNIGRETVGGKIAYQIIQKNEQNRLSAASSGAK